MRLAAAILGKVVDTLAPAITSMLVRGKEVRHQAECSQPDRLSIVCLFVCLFVLLFVQVTVGVFGYPEHIISEPLSPKVLVKLIYDYCLPYDPIEAVLQQEVRREEEEEEEEELLDCCLLSCRSSFIWVCLCPALTGTPHSMTCCASE